MSCVDKTREILDEINSAIAENNDQLKILKNYMIASLKERGIEVDKTREVLNELLSSIDTKITENQDELKTLKHEIDEYDHPDDPWCEREYFQSRTKRFVQVEHEINTYTDIKNWIESKMSEL